MAQNMAIKIKWRQMQEFVIRKVIRKPVSHWRYTSQEVASKGGRGKGFGGGFYQ
jgi:hypothetical protein